MDLETILKSEIKLPPSPQILPKLQTLLRDVDCSVFDIIDLIKLDAALAAHIMTLANSAFYGSGDPCKTVEEAVSRIGFSETFKVASMAAAKAVLGGAMPMYRLKKGELLETSIVTAVTMSNLLPKRDLDSMDAAYTVGLLHPLGMAIINSYYMERGLEIYNEEDSVLDYQLERKLLGFDNAQVASKFLKKWHFADNIIETVEYQFAPLEAPENKQTTSLLAIAQRSVPLVLEQKSLDEVTAETNPELFDAAGIETDDYGEKIERAKDALIDIKKMLGG